MRWTPKSKAFASLLLITAMGTLISPSTALGSDQRITLSVDGWDLIGEWKPLASSDPAPAVLLLHRAAGSRTEYESFAEELARQGVASLRLDLRAHGESINQGRFQEPWAEHRSLLQGTAADIGAALAWLRSRPEVLPERVGIVGASYSGESVGEAYRAGDRAAAYAILSPGSFSNESIANIDESGAPWLLVRSSEEGRASLQYIDAVFDTLAAASKTVQVYELSGPGHATRILEEHPESVTAIAEWLAGRLLMAPRQPRLDLTPEEASESL